MKKFIKEIIWELKCKYALRVFRRSNKKDIRNGTKIIYYCLLSIDDIGFPKNENQLKSLKGFIESYEKIIKNNNEMYIESAKRKIEIMEMGITE